MGTMGESVGSDRTNKPLFRRNGRIAGYVVECLVAAAMVVALFELSSSAPPVDSLPQHAQVMYAVVGGWFGTVLIGAVLLYVVLGWTLRSNQRSASPLLLVFLPPFTVMAVAELVRYFGQEIEELARWGVAEPSLFVAAVFGVLVFGAAWRVGQRFGLWLTLRTSAAFAATDSVVSAVTNGTTSASDDRAETDGITPGWGEGAADKPYRYFIAYNHSWDAGSGSGYAGVARSLPITCFHDVATIAESLRQGLLAQYPDWRNVRLSVTSWQRFESPVPEPGGQEDIPVPESSDNVVAFSARRSDARVA